MPTTDAYNQAIAQILKDEFDRQDFGATRLARAAGISRQSVYLYLDGKRPITVSKLRRMCVALRLSIGDVVGRASAELD